MTYRSDKLGENQRHLSEVVKADHIEEKGEGRLILLHGPPGLGKTYTVECAAEWSGMILSFAPSQLRLIFLARSSAVAFDMRRTW
jgi:SpoVK/Ycf46/Vps4 family AAA+-type ATPase